MYKFKDERNLEFYKDAMGDIDEDIVGTINFKKEHQPTREEVWSLPTGYGVTELTFRDGSELYVMTYDGEESEIFDRYEKAVEYAIVQSDKLEEDDNEYEVWSDDQWLNMTEDEMYMHKENLG
jgi:hypothetical protein